MFTLKAQNKAGQTIELTHNDAYTITSISGLDPPDATINTTRNAYADGSMYNSSYVGNRQITITLVINSPAETNRINLYKYFKTKREIRLFYKNDTRDVYIDGYIQSMQISIFDKKQVAQITIMCPKYEFNAVDEDMVAFSTIESLFEFPFAIEESGMEFSKIVIGEEKNVFNDGELETGITIEIYANGAVKNPTIYNVDTNEYFIIETTINRGDALLINTKINEKCVMLTAANGEKKSLIGTLKEGSTWFKLSQGDNIFIATAAGNPQNMNAICIKQDQYEGV